MGLIFAIPLHIKHEHFYFRMYNNNNPDDHPLEKMSQIHQPLREDQIIHIKIANLAGCGGHKRCQSGTFRM